jgi:hypothetical protein
MQSRGQVIQSEVGEGKDEQSKIDVSGDHEDSYWGWLQKEMDA